MQKMSQTGDDSIFAKGGVVVHMASYVQCGFYRLLCSVHGGDRGKCPAVCWILDGIFKQLTVNDVLIRY